MNNHNIVVVGESYSFKIGILLLFKHQMLKSVTTTPQIVSPTPKQKHSSFIPGFSECASITDDDRLIEISAISLMIADDLQIVIKACNELSSKFSSTTKGRMNKISCDLQVLQEYCATISPLTKKKNYTVYASSRAKTQSKFDAKVASQQYKQKGETSCLTKRSESIFTSVTKIANKKRNIEKESDSISDTRRSKRIANVNKDFEFESSSATVPSCCPDHSATSSSMMPYASHFPPRSV